MNYICDTAKECGSETCNYRLSLPEHTRLMPQLGFMCVKAGHRVYPELVPPTCTVTDEWTPGKRQVTVRCSQLSEAELCLLNGMPCNVATDGIICAFHHLEAHTCYFCDHEGADVNRIASWNVVCRGSTEYCCDDGVMCDERWQALQEDNLEAGVTAIVLGEMVRAHGIPIIPGRGFAELAGLAAKRIMKLLDLPF